MWTLLSLLPPEASSAAGPIDQLFLGLTAITVIFTLLIFVLILYFAVKYRKGNKVDRSNPPQYGLAIELIWTIIPTIILMGLFAWSTAVYFHIYRPPSGSMEITVVGKQWMWKLQHPEGKWEMNELHVPLGRNVKLTMTSEDVIHSFFVPEFRLKQDVFPGEYTQMWFKATKVGVYHLYCAEYCGTNHSGMIGTVTVLEPGDYQKWLSTGNAPFSLAADGQRLFFAHGCSGCHGRDSSLRAPLLDGIYNKPVAVQIPQAGVPIDRIQATTVLADDRYIHDSILLPEQEVAAGYKPIMPTFKNQVSEEDITKLIAYIKTLGTSNGGSNDSSKGSNKGDYEGPVTPQDIQARTGFVPSNMKNINRASKQPPTTPTPSPFGASSNASTTTPMPSGTTTRTKQ